MGARRIEEHAFSFPLPAGTRTDTQTDTHAQTHTLDQVSVGDDVRAAVLGIQSPHTAEQRLPDESIFVHARVRL